MWDLRVLALMFSPYIVHVGYLIFTCSKWPRPMTVFPSSNATASFLPSVQTIFHDMLPITSNQYLFEIIRYWVNPTNPWQQHKNSHFENPRAKPLVEWTFFSVISRVAGVDFGRCCLALLLHNQGFPSIELLDSHLTTIVTMTLLFKEGSEDPTPLQYPEDGYSFFFHGLARPTALSRGLWSY